MKWLIPAFEVKRCRTIFFIVLGAEKLRSPGVADSSAFIYFVEFCSKEMLDVLDAQDLLGKSFRFDESIFCLSHQAAKKISTMINIQNAAWDRSRGIDLIGEHKSKNVFLGDLRYCPACLNEGFHSILFQIPDVLFCSVHSLKLLKECSTCRNPIPATLLSLIRNHYYCSHCHRSLVRTNISTTSNEWPLGSSASNFRDIQVAKERSGDEQRSVVWGHWWRIRPKILFSNADQLRRYCFHCVWPDTMSPTRLWNFRTEIVAFDVSTEMGSGGNFNQKNHLAAHDAAVRAAQEVIALVSQVVPLEVHGLSRKIQGDARVDCGLPILVAALWQTMAAFRVERLLQGVMPKLPVGMPPFLNHAPDLPPAMQVVVRCNVLHLFVRCLIRMSRLHYGVQVSWFDLPNPALFLTPWRLLPAEDDRHVELQIRSRVDTSLITRLIARYKDCRLQRIPDGVAPHELIGSRDSP